MRSIIGKRSDCRSHFVDHIYIFPGGMKSEMARAGAQLDFGKRRIIRRERAMCRVEMIYEQVVEPQVRGDSEAIVVGEFSLVVGRALLALRIVAPSCMLNKRCCLTQAPIIENGKSRHIAAAIVGYQNVFTGLVANYGGGNVAAFPILNDGRLSEAAAFI